MIDAPPIAADRSDAPLPVASLWQRALLWTGLPLCLIGMVASRLGTQWHGGRFAELVVLSALGLMGAWVLRRLLRWRLSSGLAAIWLMALALFGGAVPLLATSLLALVALSLGDLLSRHAPIGIRVTCGLMLVAGALGWMLPVPLHHRAIYLVACLGLVAWRWQSVLGTGHVLMEGWRRAVDSAPRASAFGVLVLGLASTGCWIPTMQWDDVVYHLRLPWQLVDQQHYPLEPDLHVWALAPWAGDVLQAVPQVIGGAEARGSVNGLWIVLAAAGIWRIAVALGGTPRAAWFAVGLYASMPLTAALAGSMQTETPTVALLAWFVALVLQTPQPDWNRLWPGAVLVGGLLALKLASASFALLLLPWAWWVHRRRLPDLKGIAIALVIVLAIAGSSYVYAGFVAGNPFLPLFNGWFQSPYFDPVNFDDPRWHAGFNAALPWNLTFDTERYLEAYDGGGGFVLVGLAGAWLLAFTARHTAPLAVAATALVAVPLVPMQYLRYVFPAVVLLIPLLVVTAFRIEQRRAAWLIASVCVLNLAFQANSFWMLRTGMVKMSVRDVGRDDPAFVAYLPERSLITALRDSRYGNVLALDPNHPYVAELGVRGRSTSGYDRSMHAAARTAEQATDGTAWIHLLRRERISDVLLRPSSTTQAQRAALERLGATRQRASGEAEWWRIPPEATR